MVASEDTYDSKSRDALEKHFHRSYQIPQVLGKRALKKCSDPRLQKDIQEAETDVLKIFFAVKTHNSASPFRVIVSEWNTRQPCVGLFLKKGLKLSVVKNPFVIGNSFR